MSRRPLLLPLGVPAAFVAAMAGFQLARLAAAERLWGLWPLLFLLAAWAIVVALVQRRERLGLLAWGTGAGLLLGIAFAPYGALWAPVFGFAALLRMLDLAVRRGLHARQVFWYAYHAMVLFNVVATWWVANTALAAGVVANFLNAVFTATVLVLAARARRLLPRWWLGIAGALWIGFEYLHFNWQIAWPWLCLGHTFAPTPVAAQWFSITGVFGGSLYVVVAGALLYRSLLRGQRTLVARTRDDADIELPDFRRLGWFLLAGFGPLAVSVIEYAYAPRADGTPLRVAVVQPNFEPHYEKFRVDDRAQLARFAALTDTALAEGARLVIWPETSFGGVDEDALEREAWLAAWRELVAPAGAALTQPAGLLAGLSTHRRYAGRIADPALRTQAVGRGDTIFYTAHNTALAVDGGEAGPFYHKSRLVPGVEFLPYRRAMFAFEPLVASLGGTTAGLGVSDSAVVFRYASGAAVAPLICYESLYGDYVREFVHAGANLLAVPTNDGWWDDSPGYHQHFNLARLRAIETRRWVAQAANSGTSGFIDERGRAFAKTDYATADVRVEEVQLLSGQTFYVRYGDLLGIAAAVLAVLSLVWLLIAGRRPANADQPPGSSPHEVD